MLANDEQLKLQIETAAKHLAALCDGLAQDGLITAAGVAYAGLQCIKVMYLRLFPEPTAPPVAAAEITADGPHLKLV